jgi:alpha-mannosidase
VHADHATHEIQFGHIRRTNHFNTSWDYGHFEAPAQRWMDLSEPGFGVTLTNDSKYGHSCLGNVMGLSLLRSTKSPDPQADMGVHEMRYSLHLHGPFDAREAIAAAEKLNQPMRFVREGETSDSLITMPEKTGVVIDTVKPAEDGGEIIVRLYEARGGRETITLALHPKIRSVQIVDLLERPLHTASNVSGSYRLTVKPFQIVSLRLGL